MVYKYNGMTLTSNMNTHTPHESERMRGSQAVLQSGQGAASNINLVSHMWLVASLQLCKHKAY